MFSSCFSSPEQAVPIRKAVPCRAVPLPALQRLQLTPIPQAPVLRGPASLPAPLPRSPPTPAACPGRCEQAGTCQAPQLALRGYNGSLFPLAPLSHPTPPLCSDLIFLFSLPPDEARGTPPPPAPALCSTRAPQGGVPEPRAPRPSLRGLPQAERATCRGSQAVVATGPAVKSICSFFFQDF